MNNDKDLDKRIGDRLEKLKEAIEWQDQKIHGVNIIDDQRICVAASLIDLTHEIEKSIQILINEKLFGSTLALIRPLFESYIRAVWLRNCATEDEFEKFKKGEIEKHFETLIEEIENHDAYGIGTLLDLKKMNWKLMNDFTHGGISQALSRIAPDAIAANYNKNDILSAIHFSIDIGFFATMEVAFIANNGKLAQEIADKSQSIQNQT